MDQKFNIKEWQNKYLKEGLMARFEPPEEGGYFGQSEINAKIKDFKKQIKDIGKDQKRKADSIKNSEIKFKKMERKYGKDWIKKHWVQKPSGNGDWVDMDEKDIKELGYANPNNPKEFREDIKYSQSRIDYLNDTLIIPLEKILKALKGKKIAPIDAAQTIQDMYKKDLHHSYGDNWNR